MKHYLLALMLATAMPKDHGLVSRLDLLSEYNQVEREHIEMKVQEAMLFFGTRKVLMEYDFSKNRELRKVTCYLNKKENGSNLIDLVISLDVVNEENLILNSILIPTNLNNSKKSRLKDQRLVIINRENLNDCEKIRLENIYLTIAYRSSSQLDYKSVRDLMPQIYREDAYLDKLIEDIYLKVVKPGDILPHLKS